MDDIALLTRVAPETTGTDLLQEFAEVKADIAARASDRDSVVEARLRTLEAEQADLQRLQQQLA